MMDMVDLESKPHGMPLLSLLTNEQKVQWVDSVSAKILKNLQGNGNEALEKLHQDLLVLNTEDQQVQQLKMGDIYHYYTSLEIPYAKALYQSGCYFV